MLFTRRDVVKFGAAALAAAKLSPRLALAQPNSDFSGVQIGIILSPYNFPSIPLPADQYLNSLVQLDLSAVEMQDVRVEVFAGYPNTPRQGYSGARRLSPDERAAAESKQAEDLTQWAALVGSGSPGEVSGAAQALPSRRSEDLRLPPGQHDAGHAR